MLGRARPELRPDIRSFAFGSYVIFFRYKGQVFEVVNVLEGHRDIEEHFKHDDKLARAMRRMTPGTRAWETERQLCWA